MRLWLDKYDGQAAFDSEWKVSSRIVDMSCGLTTLWVWIPMVHRRVDGHIDDDSISMNGCVVDSSYQRIPFILPLTRRTIPMLRSTFEHHVGILGCSQHFHLRNGPQAIGWLWSSNVLISYLQTNVFPNSEFPPIWVSPSPMSSTLATGTSVCTRPRSPATFCSRSRLEAGFNPYWCV
jgi:hypothetical protein